MLDSLSEFYTRHSNGRPVTKQDIQDTISRSITANRISTERAKNPTGEMRVKGINSLQKSLSDTNKNLTELRVTTSRSMQSLSRQIVLTGRDTLQELRELRKTLQKRPVYPTSSEGISRRQTQSLHIPKHVRDNYIDDPARSMRSHAALIRSMSIPRDARGRWTTEAKLRQEREESKPGASLADIAVDAFAGGAIWKGIKTFGGKVLGTAGQLAARAAPYATGALRGLGALAASPIGAGLGAAALGEYAGDKIHQEDMRLPEVGEDTLTHKFARIGDKVNDALGYIGLGSHVDHSNKQAEADADMYAKADQKTEVEKKDPTAALGSVYADTINSLASQTMGWIEDKALATQQYLLDTFKSVKQIEDEQEEKDKKVKILDPALAKNLKPVNSNSNGGGSGGDDSSGSSNPGGGPGGSSGPGGGSGNPGGGNPGPTGSSGPGGNPDSGKPDATEKPVSPTGAFKPEAKPNVAPDPTLAPSLNAGKDSAKIFNPNAPAPVPAPKPALEDLDPALRQSKPPSAPVKKPEASLVPVGATAAPNSKPSSDAEPSDTANPPATVPQAQGAKPAAKLFTPTLPTPDVTPSAVNPTVPDNKSTPPNLLLNPPPPQTIFKPLQNTLPPPVAKAEPPELPTAPKAETFEELRARTYQRIREQGGDPSDLETPSVKSYNSGAVPTVNNDPIEPDSVDAKDKPDSAPVVPSSPQSLREPDINSIPQNVEDAALRKQQTTDTA